MRLYIFAIGGTGSRVLRAMVMQCAAGIVPEEFKKDGQIKNLSIVPIIIDPHVTNDALQEANDLLKRYREIRKSIYGNTPSREGYYGVRIESLKDITTDKNNNSTYQIGDSFFFDTASTISNKRFSEFIGMDEYGLDPTARMFAGMLFSRDELNTRMSEGFYGSPNIGTVALNVFQKSDSYKAFCESFKEQDRVFFIGSIFGGTGAAGLPMLVSKFRQQTKYTALRNAFMGALIVMPYFSIQSTDGSEIQESDFTIKTRTALKYYINELYPYLNCTYYVADENRTNPFDNDAGENDQKTNKSHFVEFVGGLAVIDFLGQKSNEKGNNTKEKNGRNEAAETRKFMQFELKEDSTMISFADLDKTVGKLICVPMSGFHFLSRFIYDGFLKQNISHTFAKDRGLTTAMITDDLTNFFKGYYEWLEELSDHGSTAHNFMPFKLDAHTKDYSNEIARIQMKRKKVMMGERSFGVGDFIESMNKSKAYKEMETPLGKLFADAYEALAKDIPEYYELDNIIK